MKLKLFNHTWLTSFLLLIACLILLSNFISCKDEPFEYKIDRASAFSFKLDTFDLVTTDDVVFYMGPQVLHDYDDTTQVRYQRISLEAHGMTPSSKEYWFIVDFDTHADGDAVGTYRTVYDYNNGGINDMRLIIGDNGVYIEYKALPATNSAYFQVEAQETEERLMKGIFGGVLFKDGNPMNEGAVISDGVFKDINY
jgi:hypothetical protein